MLAKGTERWNDKDQQTIEEYYGCHPRLLEGIEVFMNSEKQDCFQQKGCVDLSRHTLVKSN